MNCDSCYQCPDRQVGCHSKCEAYKEYRVKMDEVNKARHYEYVNSFSNAAKSISLAKFRAKKRGFKL